MRNKWPARFLTFRAPRHSSFPPLMSLSGQSASQEIKCPALGQGDMSRPTSLNRGATIFISTAPPPPVGLFGGGTDNIAFLLGQAAATAPNAQAAQMTAVFWIETVEEVIKVGLYRMGDPPLLIKAKRSVPGQRVPRFSVTPPFDLDKQREITQ
jgi:hypothetical protein